MAQQQPVRRKMRSSKQPVTIPDKLYFRIGDVSRLCALPAYVLRFWETEFPQLKPNKGGTGQRLYRKRDVEMALEIKRLLYDEGFTIAGARRLLNEKRRSAAGSSAEGRDLHLASAADKSHSNASGKIAAAKDSAGSGRSSATKFPAPKIQELRKEMRELLSMLGSDVKDRKPQPAAAKQPAKKGNRKDEPTLF